MYERTPIGEVARRARPFGYSGLEIAPFTLAPDPLAVDPAPLRKSVEDAGLHVIGLHWLLAGTQGLHAGSPDAAVRDRTVEHLRGLARLCLALGGSILVFGSPAQRSTPQGETRSDTVKRLTDTFARLGDTCASLGLFLCVEPLTPKETDVVNTAAEAVAIIREIGNPCVRLHLDVKAMEAEAAPAHDVIRGNAGFLKSFHANDPNLLGPGMGDKDFRPIIAALKDAGFDGYLSVEVFDFSPGPDEIARRSAEYLRHILG